MGNYVFEICHSMRIDDSLFWVFSHNFSGPNHKEPRLNVYISLDWCLNVANNGKWSCFSIFVFFFVFWLSWHQTWSNISTGKEMIHQLVWRRTETIANAMCTKIILSLWNPFFYYYRNQVTFLWTERYAHWKPNRNNSSFFILSNNLWSLNIICWLIKWNGQYSSLLFC